MELERNVKNKIDRMMKFSNGERRKITFKNFKNRHHSWIGHTIRHNEFVVNILEGRKVVGRPRLRYLKQVARNTGADSYTAKKRMACNNSRWKAYQPIKKLRDKKKKKC